jgi:hypothetical protein
MRTEQFTRSAGAALLALLLASGCATPRAAVPREPLILPPAPPRVIAPLPEPVPALPAEQQEPVPPLPRVARPATPRADPKPQPAEPAPPPADPSATTGPETAAPGPAEPELRKPETADDARAHQRVRDILDRAARTLNRVDYRALSQPARQQYDMGKRFMEQSEEALKARNYTAAVLMAEKAETIATELARR